MDNEAIAAALYGNTEPEPTAPPVDDQHVPEGDVAQRLYASETTEDAIDPTTGLDRVYAPVQRDIVAAGVEQLGLEPEEAQAAAVEWAQVFRQHDVTPDEASLLASIATGVASGAVAPDPVAWRSAARAELTSEFGANADAALKAAQALVAKDPALAQFLEDHGLGDHPAVVRAVARRAWSLKQSRG